MIWFGINKKGENDMFIKKLLQRIILGHQMRLRRKKKTQQLKNKNNRLAKLLNIKRDIKWNVSIPTVIILKRMWLILEWSMKVKCIAEDCSVINVKLAIPRLRPFYMMTSLHIGLIGVGNKLSLKGTSSSL